MDPNIKPKISIEMCAYNSVPYIMEAIESVWAQNFQDWELIILDDASIDKTEELVQSYLSDPRIRYIRHPINIGLGKNRVAGLSLARGKYVAILDSDDRWIDPRKLEEQNAFLDAHPECGVVGTFVNVINDDGHAIKKFSFETTDKNIRERMLLRDQIMNSSSLFRKEVFDKVGGYDEKTAPAEDYDLFLRMGTLSQFANLPKYMTDYRIHSKNTSGRSRIAHARLHLEVIKKFKGKYPSYFLALIKGYLRIPKEILHL